MGLFSRKNAASAPPPAVHSAPYRKARLAGPARRDLLSGSGRVDLDSSIIADYGSYMKRVFSATTRYVASASAAVWTWQHLCNTRLTMKIHGPDDSTKALVLRELDALHSRISPFKTVQTSGLNIMLEVYFRSLFKYGRFCGQLIPSPRLDGVSGFELIDPFSIAFDKQYNAYRRVDSEYRRTPSQAFYYYGLSTDQDNPYGVAMLEAARSLIAIAHDMLEDMRLSSSNAGVPRLHIKVAPPAKAEFEDPEEYRVRAQTYFTNTVSQFSGIAPDDNVYSWDDVNVGTIGGDSGPGGFVWGANRSIVDEEITSAFHLFPWILGRSFATTKNWVKSQFDVLMVQVESIQNEAERFAEWLDNTHLRLMGINNVHVTYDFQMLRDPALKDIAVAQRFQIANALTKARSGIVTPDDAARELGYDKYADTKRIDTGPSVSPESGEHSIESLAELLLDTKEELSALIQERQS